MERVQFAVTQLYAEPEPNLLQADPATSSTQRLLGGAGAGAGAGKHGSRSVLCDPASVDTGHGGRGELRLAEVTQSIAAASVVTTVRSGADVES